MGFWIGALQAFAKAVAPSHNVKIQIRFEDDGIWRDAGFVAPNTESVQGALDQFGRANPPANVRVMDAAGRVVDYR